MYVLVNGSFGIGKTAVARELRLLIPGSAIFDPEWVGLLLMRLPGYSRSDFQQSPSWRNLLVLGARLFGTFRRTVIVPMAFSELQYLEEVRRGLASSRRPVLHFCLTAPLEVVQARLTARGEPEHDPRWAWVHRRAAECCRAHESPGFAVHVAAAGSSPAAIAVHLLRRIKVSGKGPG